MHTLNPHPTTLDRYHASHKGLAPEVIAGHEEDAASWEEMLVEAGLPETALSEIRETVEQEADRRAWQRTCRVLQWIGEALCRHSTHSASVAAALGIHTLGGAPAPLGLIGARLGASKQAVGNAVARLSAVFQTAQTPRPRDPVTRPDLPGRWLSIPEIRAEFAVSPEWLKRAGVPFVARGGHKQTFYNADLVAAAIEKKKIAAAAARAARNAEGFEYRRRAAEAEREQDAEARVDRTPQSIPA